MVKTPTTRKLIYEVELLDADGEILKAQDFPTLSQAKAVYRVAKLRGKARAVILTKATEVYDSSFDPPEWMETYRILLGGRGLHRALVERGWSADFQENTGHTLFSRIVSYRNSSKGPR